MIDIKRFPSPRKVGVDGAQKEWSITNSYDEFDQCHAWLAYLENKFTQLNQTISRLEDQVAAMSKETCGHSALFTTELGTKMGSCI
jgi:hypothetical protein